MAVSHLLEALTNDLDTTVSALDLPEGTNYSTIARMARNGEITTQTGGKQFREIEFENNYCDDSLEELSENDETTLLALLEHYESGESDLILIRYVENAAGNSPDIASIRVSDFNGAKGVFLYTLSGSYSIDYAPNSTHIQPMWGNVTWRDADTDLQTQYSWIPEPSEDWVGRIIQYTDDGESGFIKGNFYECVGDWSGDDPVFTWEHINVGTSGETNVDVGLISCGIGAEFIYENAKRGVYIPNQYITNFGIKKTSADSSAARVASGDVIMTLYITKTLAEAEEEIAGGATGTINVGRIITVNYTSNYNYHFYNVYIDATTHNLSINNTYFFYDGLYYLTGGTQTILGQKTFNIIPRQSGTTAPTLNNELTNKKYVDDQDSYYYNEATTYTDNQIQSVTSDMYNINYYATSGDPRLVGKYNGREIWRKTFEYDSQTIQNWQVEQQGTDCSTYMVQLPQNLDNLEFVIDAKATAEVYISSTSMSFSIPNTVDPLGMNASCQLLQFIKNAPDGHQYFRLLLGDNVHTSASKIRITIEWVNIQIQ